MSNDLSEKDQKTLPVLPVLKLSFLDSKIYCRPDLSDDSKKTKPRTVFINTLKKSENVAFLDQGGKMAGELARTNAVSVNDILTELIPENLYGCSAYHGELTDYVKSHDLHALADDGSNSFFGNRKRSSKKMLETFLERNKTQKELLYWVTCARRTTKFREEMVKIAEENKWPVELSNGKKTTSYMPPFKKCIEDIAFQRGYSTTWLYDDPPYGGGGIRCPMISVVARFTHISYGLVLRRNRFVKRPTPY